MTSLLIGCAGFEPAIRRLRALRDSHFTNNLNSMGNLGSAPSPLALQASASTKLACHPNETLLSRRE